MYMYMYVCICVCVCVCIYKTMYMLDGKGKLAEPCMRTCVHACVCVCVCVYLHVGWKGQAS